MEGIPGIATMGLGIREGAYHPEKLHQRARPAMGENQRAGLRAGGANMKKMDIQSVDASGELWQGIESRFHAPQVVVILPVVNQIPEIGQRNALGPIPDGFPFREAGPG